MENKTNERNQMWKDIIAIMEKHNVKIDKLDITNYETIETIHIIINGKIGA